MHQEERNRHRCQILMSNVKPVKDENCQLYLAISRPVVTLTRVGFWISALGATWKQLFSKPDKLLVLSDGDLIAFLWVLLTVC